ncbi:MAG: hypothetical protein ACI8X5_003189 [Planctomycetota bacterium]|jgi:hypothetical protein
MVVFMALAGMLFISVSLSTVEVRDSRRTVDSVRVKFLAESGFERGMQILESAVALSSQGDALAGLSNMFAVEDTIFPIAGESLMDAGNSVGGFAVTMTKIDESANSITIKIDATGYLPGPPATLAPGQRISDWDAISVNVRYELAPSEVFNYAYFINNWGWFYGNTIFANGNARSNGQFDVAGYEPTISGQPLYDGTDNVGAHVLLTGYHDDNEDGLEDGEDGGLWSGWDILDAQNLQGTGGLASNQHDFSEAIDMPNLSDLTWYKKNAIDEGGEIVVDGVTAVSGVYGDDPGETGNLYLYGTHSKPIMLDGPIVATGDVVIHGYVKGQGTIYAGGNVYVPDSITYRFKPSSPRPQGTNQVNTEAWMTANQSKDFLGLFAAENIVVGDYTHSLFQSYVGGWMNSSLNSSKEDAGEDLIPNTKNGIDGISGTADDDVLEGDGVFTVDHYTASDGALGIIPSGKSVGDVIPGSGEDIDGDGVYDSTSTISDVGLTAALDTANWGGNMPVGGISDYSDIASLEANHLDAVFYTNHTFAYLVLGSQAAEINGGLISRNEAIVYGTPSISINHDSRLLGGNSGLVSDMMPKTMGSPTILRWQELDSDPNRHQVVVVEP